MLTIGQPVTLRKPSESMHSRAKAGSYKGKVLAVLGNDKLKCYVVALRIKGATVMVKGSQFQFRKNGKQQ